MPPYYILWLLESSKYPYFEYKNNEGEIINFGVGSEGHSDPESTRIEMRNDWRKLSPSAEFRRQV